MTSRAFGLAATLLLGVGTGCTHYEYDLVRPQELARHVGTTGWAAFQVDEIEYRLRTSDDRLVILVYNRGERNVKLSGPDSAAVDPHGESHPLPSQTLPPGSFTKLIFPPSLPQVRSYGPTFGMGVGVGYSRRFGRRYQDGLGFGSGLYDDEPRYYTIRDPADRTYFEWPDGGEVRLLLAFDRESGGRLQHAFTFRRRKTG